MAPSPRGWFWPDGVWSEGVVFAGKFWLVLEISFRICGACYGTYSLGCSFYVLDLV